MDYIIDEERMTKLIIKVIKRMDILDLYRVNIGYPNTKGSSKEIAIGLFFNTVSNSQFYGNVRKMVKEELENLFGINFFVVTIPYSEAKYHLLKPKNI